MSLNLEEKKAVVAEVSEQVNAAQAIVLAEYRGLEVGDMTQLRAQARKSGVYLRVLKNTLVRRAVDGTPFSGLANEMVGPLVFGISADPVAAAKVLNDFAKGNDKFVIKAGAMPNQVMDVKGVQALASMPSREELLAKRSVPCRPRSPSSYARLMKCLPDLYVVWQRYATRSKQPNSISKHYQELHKWHYPKQKSSTQSPPCRCLTCPN